MVFESNGARMNYEVAGDSGRVLLLLHGWGGCINSWLPVIRDFQRECRTVVGTIRSFGADIDGLMALYGDMDTADGRSADRASPLAARCARRLSAGARGSSRCTASRAARFWCLPNRAMTAPTSASPTARSSRACLKTMPSRLAPTRWVVLHKPIKRHGASRAPPIVPFIVAKDPHDNCSALQSAVDQPVLCPHIGSGGLR